MKRPEDLSTTQQQRDELDRLLSGGRMNSYTAAVAEAAGHPFDQLDLYAYNMALAGALLGPLHILEIATRNAIHAEFVTRTGRNDWWNDPQVDADLTGWAHKQITNAEDQVNQKRGTDGAPASPDDIIAATEFGFWTALTARNYERTLWQQTVRLAFPNSRRDRQQIFQALRSHRRLRNRVTHHEPLHHTDIGADYTEIIRFIGFISPPIATWVDDRSRVQAVLAAKPGLTQSPVRHF